MRDLMEKLVILPFSGGCVSQSSVAVSLQKQQQPRRIQEEQEEERSVSSSSVKYRRKNNTLIRMIALPKHNNISTGFLRLFKISFKSFSQLFVYKEEMEELEMEMEMQIGFPTDVKHVTHIGLDGSGSGSATTNPIKGGHHNHNNNLMASDLLSLTPLSLRQFELAMASQVAAAADTVPLPPHLSFTS